MGKIIRFIPLILFMAIAIVFYRGLSLNPQDIPSALKGKPMPKFQLSQLLDETKQLTEADLKGDIVLLNVWGTWCVYCKYEHPYLVEIAKDKRVSLYGLNYKDVREDAKLWLQDYKDPYRLSVFDPLGKLGIDLGVTAAPETFVIDREGIIRMKHVGPIDEKVWIQKFVPMIEQLEAEYRTESTS